MIIAAGCFPKVFKTAAIILIHKLENKNYLNNYQSISMTSSLKITEKVLHSRLLNFLSINILSKNQFRFGPDLSASDALYEIIKQIYSNLNSNKLRADCTDVGQI